jgi:hypothetical protein
MAQGFTHRESDALELVRQRYPFPIAHATRRLLAATDENARFQEAPSVGKALIVTLGTVAMAWCRAEGMRPEDEPAGVRQWRESFNRRTVSLGRWVAAAHDTARLAHRSGYRLAGFAAALGDEQGLLRDELDSLVSWRNRYGSDKSGAPRGAARSTRLREYEEHLLAALAHCRFLAEMSFVLVESSRRKRNGRHHITAREVHGENRVLLPLPPFESPWHLHDRTLYILQETERDLELTPYWTVQDCESCEEAELCFLNKRKGKRFEHASFTTNHVFIDEGLPRELGWFQAGPESVRRPRPRPSEVESVWLTDPERLTGRRWLPPDRINLPRLYRLTQSSLVRALRIDPETGGKGWNHHLDLPLPTVLATATGLRVMRIVSPDSSPFRADEVLETLWNMRVKDGCWSATSQFPIGRPEVTSAVLASMWTYGEHERARQALRSFERLLSRTQDEALWRRVYCLAAAVPTLATLGSRQAVLAPLLDALLAAAVDDRAGQRYWTALTPRDPDFGAAAPSAAHTGHAVSALWQCYQATDGTLGASPQELEPAVAWLLGNPWPNTSEDIRRRVGDYRYETLVFRHFTGPVVVRTLLELDVDPSQPRITSEVARLYASHRDGLWDWDDVEQRVERPAWATLDALRALTEYALRASPAGPPPSPPGLNLTDLHRGREPAQPATGSG